MTAALLRANRRTFASLRRHRNYRLFFSGQVISVSGTWMQNIATGWLVLDFIISLWLFGYDRNTGGFQFLEDHEWIRAVGARYQMGADGVAVLLIVLTTFLGVLAALSSWKYIAKREKED